MSKTGGNTDDVNAASVCGRNRARVGNLLSRSQSNAANGSRYRATSLQSVPKLNSSELKDRRK